MGRYIRYLILFLLFASTVQATDYYVSPTGTTVWPNCTTQESPCLASNTTDAFLGAVAGDTVYFLDGTYSGLTYSETAYQTPAWNPLNSGTSTNPVTFKSLNQYGAHLIGLSNQTGKPYTNMIGSYGPDYIVWDGFKLSAVDGSDNASSAIVKFISSNGSVVRNCEIIGHTVAFTDNREGVRIESSSNVLVENNIIHGFKAPDGNHNNSGTKQYYTTGATIRNNEIYDNSAGIYVKYDNDNTTIENNYIYNNNSNGILVSANSTAAQGHVYTITNNILANNTVINIEFMNGGSYYLDSAVIANNTFYGNNSSQVISYRSGILEGYDPLKVYNNIFYGDTYPLRTVYNFSTIKEADHNNFGSFNTIRLYDYGTSAVTYANLTAWQASTVLTTASDQGCGSTTHPGCGSLASNPQFVNTSGTMSEIADFALAVGSPCIDAGRAGVDMGADVTQVGVEGDPPPPPDPPVVSAGSPAGNVAYATSVTLAVTTDIAATCKFDTSDVAYASMSGTFDTTGGTSHSEPNVVTTVGPYTYYVLCSNSGSYNSPVYVIDFTILEEAGTAPVRSNGQPDGIRSYRLTETLSLTTDENATCKYSKEAEVAYASMLYTFSVTGTTSHTASSTPVEIGENNFYVRCVDGSSNANTDDYLISFTINQPELSTTTVGVGTAVSIGVGTTVNIK